MYRVYCDGQLIYHSKLESLQIFAPSLELELNKTGSFVFTVFPSHPRYDLLKKLKSIITVYQDDFLLFRGRVLDGEIGFHNEKRVSCEGELAFLLDSIQRPYDFTGGVAEFLSMLITNHNAQMDKEKQFTLGNVTVTDPNNYIVRSDIDYVSTWEVINKKLLDMLGGFLFVRHENGQNIIDYLAEAALLSPQKIRFGENLLDLKRIRKGSDIATVVIPLGAKLKDAEGRDTDKRLTIESVNGGLDYVEDAVAKASFGAIAKTVVFDDVTLADNLKAKGQVYLAGLVQQLETIELTAADLATVDKAVTSFHLGTQVKVISKPHGIDQLFAVSKLSIKLLDPAANKLTLGMVSQTLSGAVSSVEEGRGILLQTIEQNAQTASEAVYNVEQNLMATIQVSEQNIKTSVAERYYLKEDTDALVSSVSTEVQQTKDSFNIEFASFQANIDSLALSTDAEFEEIKKYIRFVGGKILLGQVGNELELQIANDRINFLQDGAEVAYFTNRKLYVTDAEILHSLQLGGFAFMPRANGNISFKRTK